MNAPVPAQKQSQRSETVNSPSEIRVAYPFFHKKRTHNAAKKPFTKKDGTLNPRYSASFMFPKLHADPHQDANYLFLWGLAVEAAKKMWPGSVDQAGNWAIPPGMQYAVKDGDVPFASKPKPGQPIPSAEEIAKKNAWRKGYWIVEAERFLDPGPRVCKVINGTITELPADNINGVLQYKGGDYGFVSIQAYAYENETFGVNFGFDGFLFTRAGDVIGNGGQSGPPPASQMFGSVAGAALAAAPAASAPLPGAAAPVAPTAPVAAAGGLPPLPSAVAAPPAPAAPVAAAGGLPPIPTR
jgi:hypothetical protein